MANVAKTHLYDKKTLVRNYVSNAQDFFAEFS